MQVTGPTDVVERLKRIEKLAKQLRSQIAQWSSITQELELAHTKAGAENPSRQDIYDCGR